MSIQIGKHLVTDTPTGIWEVHFKATETKTRREMHYEVTESLRRRLDHYMDTTRKQILAGRASTFLFPTRSGKPVYEGEVLTQLKDIDTAFRKVPRKDAKHIHLIRDIVTATCVRKLPNGTYRASKLLGHRGMGTTAESYYGAFGREQIIEDRRDMSRIVEKPVLSREDVDQVVQVLTEDPDELRRFKKGLSGFLNIDLSQSFREANKDGV